MESVNLYTSNLELTLRGLLGIISSETPLVRSLSHDQRNAKNTPEITISHILISTLVFLFDAIIQVNPSKENIAPKVAVLEPVNMIVDIEIVRVSSKNSLHLELKVLVVSTKVIKHVQMQSWIWHVPAK